MNQKGKSIVSWLSSREIGSTSTIKFHPKAVCYFKPCTSTTKESDLNKTKYYEDEINYFNRYETPTEIIQSEILSSTVLRMYLEGGNPRRTMKPYKGDVILAHVPLKEDFKAGQKEWAYIYIMWDMEKVQRESDLVISDELQVVIDPQPFVDHQPSVTLPMPDTPTTIFMGGYSDGVHAMEVSSTIHTIHIDVGCRKLPKSQNRYYISHLRPGKSFHIENRPQIPLGSIVLFWNCRGMTRKSFLDNFIFLFHKYAPKIFVLAETRIAKLALEYVERKLGIQYNLEIFGRRGGPGGVAVFWDAVLLTHFFLHRGYQHRGLAVSVIYEMHRTKVEYEDEANHEDEHEVEDEEEEKEEEEEEEELEEEEEEVEEEEEEEQVGYEEDEDE